MQQGERRGEQQGSHRFQQKGAAGQQPDQQQQTHGQEKGGGVIPGGGLPFVYPHQGTARIRHKELPIQPRPVGIAAAGQHFQRQQQRKTPGRCALPMVQAAPPEGRQKGQQPIQTSQPQHKGQACTVHIGPKHHQNRQKKTAPVLRVFPGGLQQIQRQGKEGQCKLLGAGIAPGVA